MGGKQVTTQPAMRKITKTSPCTVGTVGDLIAMLQTFDPNLHIVVTADSKRYAFLEVIESFARIAGVNMPVDHFIQFDLQGKDEA
jgi:hypothetical protein